MADFRKRTGGTFYKSVVENPTITKPTSTNAAAVIAEFDALTYSDMGILNSFNVEHLLENENTNYAMNCDIAGAFLTTADKKFNINSTIYSPNMDIISDMLDYYRQSILGTPVVGETFDYAVGTAYDTAVLPKSKEASYSLTSLIEDNTAYSLIENTDYTLSTVNGVVYVTFINSGNYDLTTNKVVATYDYTPKAAEVMSGTAENIKVPYYAFKFESCTYEAIVDGVQGTYQDVYYMNKTKLGGSILDTYLNTGENLEASDVVLNGELGAVLLKQVTKVA